MSIEKEFDCNSEPMFGPLDYYKKAKNVEEEVTVVTFSIHAKRKILCEYRHKIIAHIGTANGSIPIYRIFVGNVKILFYMSPISSALAGTSLQEANAILGAKKFVFFGSCGVLDQRLKNQIILPTESYRGEGLSYHYLSSSDYIKMKNASILENYFLKHNLTFTKGRNYCTDAFYQETKNKIAQRRNEGCISVDMESSGLEAVATYLNLDLYLFFFAGDVITKNWEIGNMDHEKEKRRQKDVSEIAMDFAMSLLSGVNTR